MNATTFRNEIMTRGSLNDNTLIAFNSKILLMLISDNSSLDSRMDFVVLLQEHLVLTIVSLISSWVFVIPAWRSRYGHDPGM